MTRKLYDLPETLRWKRVMQHNAVGERIWKKENHFIHLCTLLGLILVSILLWFVSSWRARPCRPSTYYIVRVQ